MTQREQQILEWIRQDPMISQEDLAQRAGITRSSVGVHISNLMKKGCILGKGYLLPAMCIRDRGWALRQWVWPVVP